MIIVSFERGIRATAVMSYSHVMCFIERIRTAAPAPTVCIQSAQLTHYVIACDSTTPSALIA